MEHDYFYGQEIPKIPRKPKVPAVPRPRPTIIETSRGYQVEGEIYATLAEATKKVGGRYHFIPYRQWEKP